MIIGDVLYKVLQKDFYKLLEEENTIDKNRFHKENHGLHPYLTINTGCLIPVQMGIFRDNFNVNEDIVTIFFAILFYI